MYRISKILYNKHTQCLNSFLCIFVIHETFIMGHSLENKPIEYTHHAYKQMKERKISGEEIEAVRTFGRIVNVTGNILEVHLGKRGQALVVIFRDCKEKILVITVYRE